MGYVLNAIRIACLFIYGAFESFRYKGGLMWSNDLNVYTTVTDLVNTTGFESVCLLKWRT
jgi:hypothetical protein